jgi:hypothetical protein
LEDELLKYKLGMRTDIHSEMYNRILVHDKSKYIEPEFSAYRQWFYPDSNETKNKDLFDSAWRHHYTFNDHHPEYYYIGDTKVVEMSVRAMCEMFCDWLAMSIKFNNLPSDWFIKRQNTDPFRFHPNTEAFISEYLPDVDQAYIKFKEKK